jgi:hypothetical protein
MIIPAASMSEEKKKLVSLLKIPVKSVSNLNRLSVDLND